MHITLFDFFEDLNSVLQCPIQIVECESLAIMGTWDVKPDHVGGLVCRAVSDISQSTMSSVPVIREVKYQSGMEVWTVALCHRSGGLLYYQMKENIY